MATASQSAWNDLDTRAAYRRSRRVGRVLLVIALALWALAQAVEARRWSQVDSLVAHGTRTTGVVLQDPPLVPPGDPGDRWRCTGKVRVPVAFDVEGVRQLHTFWADECSGNGLAAGDRLTVWYDRAKPRNFVVDGMPNDTPQQQFLMVAALWVFAVLVVVWAFRAWRLQRVKSALRKTPWTESDARTASLQTRWGTWRIVIEPADDSTTQQYLTPLLLGYPPLEAGSTQPLLLAGSGVFRVVRVPGSNQLTLARRPRTKRARAQARRSLPAQDTSHSPT